MTPENQDEKTIEELSRQLIAMERDRHKLLQAQEHVSQLLEEWSATVNAIPDGVMLLDADLKVRKVNRAFCEMFDRTPEESVDSFCFELVHGEAECFEGCPGRRAFTENQPISWEWFDDKSERFFESTATPILGLDGETVIGAVDVVRNITAKKQAEQALRESEQWFRHLSDAASEALVIHDGRSVLDTNRGFLRAFGFRRDEVIGLPPAQLLAEAWPFATDAPEVSASTPIETRARRKDGSDFPVEGWEREFPYHGRTVRLLALRDLTARREIEAERLRRGRLEASIQLAGAAGHEMNQPLQVICGYCDILLEKVAHDRELHPALSEMSEQVDRLAAIARKLQRIGRNEIEAPEPWSEIIAMDEDMATSQG